MVPGAKIRKLRTERGLTLSALASACGLTKGFLSQVESGYSTPSIASLARIAAALNVTSAALITSEKSEPPEQIHLRRALPGGQTLPTVPSLSLVDRAGDTNYYLCTLDAGSRLLSAASVGGDAAKALMMVRRGSVRVRQAGVDLLLSDGEVATWNAARAYLVENSYRRLAEILICLPSTASPPRLEVATEAAIGRGPVAVTRSEGPFRLVMMRAERRLVGRP